MFSIKFNKAQISHRHATDAPPTHHRRMLYVISSKSGQRVGRLSVDCRPTVGRLSTDALADVLADASVGSDSLPLPTFHPHNHAVKSIKACSNALDFVYHTTFDLYTLQSRVRLNTLYSAHYTRFDKSNRV